MDSAIDAICVLPPGSAMLLPRPLMPKKAIVVNSWQSMPTPFWPDFEGDAVMFENLPGCIRWAIGPPLISRSWVSEASAILPPANPRNRFLPMAVESDDSNLRVFSQVGKGVIIAPQTLQDDQQLAPL